MRGTLVAVAVAAVLVVPGCNKSGDLPDAGCSQPDMWIDRGPIVTTDGGDPACDSGECVGCRFADTDAGLHLFCRYYVICL
jgi:hypothetical protein